jgi:hypothetical protein
MGYLLYGIPFLDALIVGALFYLMIKFIKEQTYKKIQSEEFLQSVDPLLDKRLESLFEGIKVEIPMSAMLLSGPFADKLKGQSKGEILKMAPDIKERMENSKTIKKRSCQFVIVGAVLGFCLGLLNVALILL